MQLFDFKKEKAQRLHDEGQRLDARGQDEEAIERYLSAIDCDPMRSESYYNIGLIYKYQGRWSESFEFNKKANEIDPADKAARWNLAIAATALRDWGIARKAWKENGIELGDGEGPIEKDFGITSVRLNPADKGEVVWGTRIDPVRVRIDSIPLPESGYHYGDVVLNDGAAAGVREIDEREYPVFNALELFEKSSFKTCIARVAAENQSDIEKLEELFSESHCEFEDWTINVRTLCRQCSEGKPHEYHDRELASNDYGQREGWNSERKLGVAYHNIKDVCQLFDSWQKLSSGILLEIFDDQP